MTHTDLINISLGFYLQPAP